MKAFVSYQFGTDISQVYKLLKNHDVEFFSGITDINYGASFQSSTFKAIDDCDFFVVLYNNQNANLAFETGIAAALKKPIFAVISAFGDQFPDFLIDSVHVFAEPTDYEKLKFTFEIFINKIKPKRKKEKREASSITNTKVENKNWLEIYNTIQSKNESRLEDLFEEILQFYKLQFIKRKEQETDFIADFSVWSDALNIILGNPILIEVKKTITERNLNVLQRQIQSAFEKTNAQSGIVLFGEAVASKEKLAEINSSNLLFISFTDLLAKLGSRDLENAIMACRNELMHKPS